jgi:hypothetical protein
VDVSEENFPDAYELLRGTIMHALEQLSEEYHETPLEAAGHVAAILEGVIAHNAQFASLYDEALVNPKLMEDLVSGKMNTEVASAWGSTEVAIRRTRKKLQALGMI